MIRVILRAPRRPCPAAPLAVLLQLVKQGFQANPENFRGSRLVILRMLQRDHESAPFSASATVVPTGSRTASGSFSSYREAWLPVSRGRSLAEGAAGVIAPSPAMITARSITFLKFTDVAGPLIALQHVDRLAARLGDLAAVFPVHVADQRLGQNAERLLHAAGAAATGFETRSDGNRDLREARPFSGPLPEPCSWPR